MNPLAFLEPKHTHVEALTVRVHEREEQPLSWGDSEDQMAEQKAVFYEYVPEILWLLNCEPHSHCGIE